MEQFFTLEQLSPGQSAKVLRLDDHGEARQKLLNLGMTPGTAVECVGVSPAGDPMAFLLRGALIALRLEDCEKIMVYKPESAALI